MATSRSSGRLGAHRALLVLGLLAGLFAMHGLTANHDTTALEVSRHPAVASQAHAGAASSMDEMDAMVARSDLVRSAAVASPADEHGHGGHSGAEACMAVLIAGLGLGLLLAAARARSMTSLAPLLLGRPDPKVHHRTSSRVYTLSLIQLNLSRT